VKKIAIISDFDGTISRRDIGHHFFGTFIPDRERWLELLQRWRMGLISSRECLEHEIALVRADREDLDVFLDGEGLDPYFKDFIDFCERRTIDVLITSDGLDYYIDRMLMRFGLGYLEFNANRLLLEDAALDGVEFPFFNAMECTRCGNCKRFHLEKLKSEGYLTVYVGNGYSDRCPAEHADVVLAKGELLEHCRAQRIAHIQFENFRDVERELTSRFILHSGNISL
jgi:2-hydroxy-3-keto-5-methylthiopentenyl-1-phosphate phosphatase